ncbi:hypothetical protein [Haloarchaeobius amylolyticus]|uniref:hypothetical protein n=1 Tax=Haloarchaeobius amylolyticus TaxID=1198296 RepID=UPI0022717FCA|nr:hypothetical protein [Haloarchaeobius amylolyticus]
MSRTFLSVLFALDIVLLVLLGLGYQFTDPGSPERAISQVSFVVLLATIVGLAVVIRRGGPFYEP